MSQVIAIDGPAAAGKGTLARALAQALDYAYLDTGSLYRAVGLKAAANEAAAVQAANTLSFADLQHPDLRSPHASERASQVAAMPEVRKALVAFQRQFGEQPPNGKTGAVLDGRDIGTVIFPDAAVKLFITAHPRVRAHRRYRELEPATRPDLATVRQQIETRDARDLARAEAPLKPAADAYHIDSSDLDADQVLNLALSFVAKAR